MSPGTSVPFGLLIYTAVWPKIGGYAGFGELGPRLALWPGPRPTSVPSGILIYSTVWPQTPQ